MKTDPSTYLRTLTASALLGSLAIIASVCSAGEAAPPLQVVVRFADLNISTPQGAEALYRRIHSAAGYVCRRIYEGDREYAWRQRACLHELTANAVGKVNAPALSAVFASKYPGLSAPTVLAAARDR